MHDVYVNYNVTWSDHFPLMLQCNLKLLTPRLNRLIGVSNQNVIWGQRGSEQISRYKEECNSLLKCIDFPIELTHCADKYCSEISHRKVLDTLYKNIVSALCVAATRTASRKRKSKKQIVGWNRHVSDAHRAAREKFHEWTLCGRPEGGRLFNEMCETRRIFKSRLKWCQDHQVQIKMNILASQHSKKDFRSFWKATNNMNFRPSCPVSVNGKTDTKDIANTFKDHFIVKSSLGLSQDEMSDAEINAEPGPGYLAKDVAKAIKSISRGKSPGHDGLSIEHLQNAGPHISRVLALFYTLCVRHCYLPEDMMKTIVIPVPKNKTGDLSDTNNYRPISLATVVAKVFDSVINVQLNKCVSLNPNQFGFRPGLSTETAILCLKHTVKYYLNRKTPVYACYLDLSKAFDLVSYNILWRKLKDINLPNETIQILRYWYGNQVNSVRWSGILSDPYRLECGVRQGGLTSPTLFNLYINELLEALGKTHIGCHIDTVCMNNLSYADDMVLLSASACGLRKLLSICETYAIQHGLKYNVDKTQYMVFEPTGYRIPKVPPINLNGSPLERVMSFKYLGHVVTSDLKDNMDIERERRALSVRANMIARKFARCTREVKLTLFRAYCTSLYTCSLWTYYTQRAYGALRVQYNNAFRVLVGLPRFCSASGMFAEARVDCFYTTMRKRCTSLVRRVRASPNPILRSIAERFDCPYLRHCDDMHVSRSTYYV